MKICLKEDKLLNEGNPEIKIYYGEDIFLDDCEIISNDIIRRFSGNKYGLVGIARGGLPMLTVLSDRLNIKRCDVVQINNDNPNKIDLLYETLNSDILEYIIFIDIIYEDSIIKYIVDELIKRGKKILAIYALVLKTKRNNKKINNEHIDIYYLNKINDKQIISFMWENSYLDI